jgi:hypothetical protein
MDIVRDRFSLAVRQHDLPNVTRCVCVCVCVCVCACVCLSVANFHPTLEMQQHTCSHGASFAKLFPLVGLRSEGLQEFQQYLCSLVRRGNGECVPTRAIGFYVPTRAIGSCSLLFSCWHVIFKCTVRRWQQLPLSCLPLMPLLALTQARAGRDGGTRGQLRGSSDSGF